MLWMDAPWSDLPTRDGADSPGHRRLMAWAESGVRLDRWRAYLDLLDERKEVRWDACCSDGIVMAAKKGAGWAGRRQEAREQRAWFWPRARGRRSESRWRRLPLRRENALSRRGGAGASAAAVPSAAGPGGGSRLVETRATPRGRGWASGTSRR